MNNITDNIDMYISHLQEFISDFNGELKKKEYKISMFYDVYNIVMYYKENINYNIDKYEIHCRALRDKLNESEIQ